MSGPPRRRLRAAFALSAAQNRPRQTRGRTMSIETWTAERIEQLRSYVDTGLTCSQIAAEIGVTRNAVIGKIHRLGLSPGRPAGAPARSALHAPGARAPQRSLRLMFAEVPCLAEEPTPRRSRARSAARCSNLRRASAGGRSAMPSASRCRFCVLRQRGDRRLLLLSGPCSHGVSFVRETAGLRSAAGDCGVRHRERLAKSAKPSRMSPRSIRAANYRLAFFHNSASRLHGPAPAKAK